MTQILGTMLIGGQSIRGMGGEIRAVEARTGNKLEPSFGGACSDDLERACRLAEDAFDAFRETELETRARFLEEIALNLEGSVVQIVERGILETGLPRARLEGELARTANQLRLFATVVREREFLDVRVNASIADRKPSPRPDLRLRNIPLGPVAVFGASNFPLAFSVAGGDTASALAAGCPVVVKAHNAHPGLSELAGRAIQQAVANLRLPPGVFSLLFDADVAIGQALVAHPVIKAVGFTGSRRGGIALAAIAQARPEPIPFHAEMSSINPVILLPGALRERGHEIALAFVSAMTLGAGQFCTNPGLVFAVDDENLGTFVQAAGLAVEAVLPATMLTRRILRNFRAGVDELARRPGVEAIAQGLTGGDDQGRAALFETSSATFKADQSLQAEVFGAATLIVRCPDIATIRDLLMSMEGQLTISLHADQHDFSDVRALLPVLEAKAGRIIFNGFGTGVEVAHAMVHGGPFPATSDSRFTAVGSLSVRRFLRPICYQDFPPILQPATFNDGRSVT
ncbi:MAG: aldehyde dehydrogenase (NADP(+)) [Hyphomonadaceae bacterium]